MDTIILHIFTNTKRYQEQLVNYFTSDDSLEWLACCNSKMDAEFASSSESGEEDSFLGAGRW